MKSQFLKIAGVKTEKEFYEKYPTEEEFFAKCGAKIKASGGFWGSPGTSSMGGGSTTAGSPAVATQSWGQGFNYDTGGLSSSIQDWQYGGNTGPVSPTNPQQKKKKKDSKGVMGFVDKLTGGDPIMKVMDYIEGFKKQKEAVAKAKQNMVVMQNLEDAKVSNDLYAQQEVQAAREKSYIRPEDNVVTGEELFPIYGVGTNVLAKKGKKIKAWGGFGGGTGASAAGASGGMKGGATTVSTASKTGSGGNWQQYLGGVSNTAIPRLAQYAGMDSDMGTQLGGEIGGTIGGAVGGPIGQVIGQYAGGFIGGAIDKSDSKIARYNEASNVSLRNMSGINMAQQTRNIFSANVKNGGKFYGMGGDVKTHGEGSVTPISYNPYGGVTEMINGPSHDKGGVDMTVYNTPLEAEGGEPMVRVAEEGASVDESIAIMGNLEVPSHLKKSAESFTGETFSGKKFKTVTKSIADVENKTNKTVERSISKAEDYTPLRPLDRISLNSLDLNIKSADKKLKKLQIIKEGLATAQETINEVDRKPGKYSPKRKAQEGDTIFDSEQDAIDAGYENIDGKWQKIVEPGMEGFEIIIPGEKGTPGSTNVSKTVSQAKKTKKQATDPDKYLKDLAKSERFKGVSGEEMANKKYISKDYIDKWNKLTNYSVSTTPGTPDTPEQITKIDDIEPIIDYATIKDKKEDGKFKWPDLSGIRQIFNRSDAEPFDYSQLIPETWAMVNNTLEPVQAQKYQPRLRVPYDISLQDQLNEITASSRSAERATANNPGLMGNLKAQEYMADSRVLGDQFRQNQGFKDQVYTQNYATLNDADLKNLAIADTQYVRQEQAKSNTKATAFEAIKSMSDKWLKHRLENRTLRVWENMYDYRYGPGYRAFYTGEGWRPEDNWNVAGGSSNVQIPAGYEISGYDKYGRPRFVPKGDNTEWTGTPGFNPAASYPPTKLTKNGSIVKKYKKFK